MIKMQKYYTLDRQWYVQVPGLPLWHYWTNTITNRNNTYNNKAY